MELQSKTDLVAIMMKELVNNGWTVEKVKQWLEENIEKSIDLYQAKNVAYGDSFGQTVSEYGPVAALVRMGDKFNRVKSLLVDKNRNDVKDEAVTDTLVDLAMYSMMTVWELLNNQNLED